MFPYFPLIHPTGASQGVLFIKWSGGDLALFLIDYKCLFNHEAIIVK